MTPLSVRRPGAAAVLLLLGWPWLGATSAQEERMFQLEERQLIAWAFGDVMSLAAARQRAEDLLAGRLEFVAQIGSLQPSQRRKLELAGRGDIVRFFESVERLLSQLPHGSVRQSEWQEAWQKLAPVRQQFTWGLHERGSLFHKTVRTTLTAEQLEALDRLEQQRARRHYEAQIAAALAMFDSHVPLTIAQRQRLTELLLAQPLPPRQAAQNPYQYWFIFYRMSRLPEQELKRLFDEVEWKVVGRWLDQFRGLEGTFQQWEEGNFGEVFNF